MVGLPLTEILFEADHASRSFTNGIHVRALVDASCQVIAGERIAIVGPSGSGKSTLLNLMAGLDQPSSGRIGWPALGQASALRPRQIAIVFQTISLIPSLTSLENVELPLLLAGHEEEAESSARAALAVFGMTDLAGHLPEELSGGQAQRVALARAIVGSPRLVLADEPTGQLDRVTSAAVLDRIIAWAERSRSALVMATHDEADADRMQRIWRMDHGHLDATGRSG
jgi:putative ABC transport system ATP-binding protein/lipoprotein-releasing system ATP-binding protein